MWQEDLRFFPSLVPGTRHISSLWKTSTPNVLILIRKWRRGKVMRKTLEWNGNRAESMYQVFTFPRTFLCYAICLWNFTSTVFPILPRFQVFQTISIHEIAKLAFFIWTSSQELKGHDPSEGLNSNNFSFLFPAATTKKAENCGNCFGMP